MKNLYESLQNNLTELKKRLPSEDILTYEFETQDKTACAIIYADGIVNKQLLGELVARPLSHLDFGSKNENDGGRVALKPQKSDNDKEQAPSKKAEIIEKSALFPELKTKTSFNEV